MSFETIEFTRREDGIAVVRLNRPQRLNAINGRVLEELDAAVDAIDADPGIRVFLLCGSPRPDGRPCFSAGFDLKSVAERVPLEKVTTWNFGQAREHYTRAARSEDEG